MSSETKDENLEDKPSSVEDAQDDAADNETTTEDTSAAEILN